MPGLISLVAAFGFMLYGGRLFLMLRSFPIDSRGRRKKIQEVLLRPPDPCRLLRAVLGLHSTTPFPLQCLDPPHVLLRSARQLCSQGPASRDCLAQVGFVTTICTFCFIVRSGMVFFAALDPRDGSLNVMNHPILNFVYYLLVELIPSALVLYILRKLPPKRSNQGYQNIPAN